MMAGSLTAEDREKIFAELIVDRDVSWSGVARVVGVHRTTVAREVARNGGRERYSPWMAQSRCDAMRTRPRLLKLADPLLVEQVERELKEGFSPAGTARRLADRGIRISHETIYQGVYGGLIDVDPKQCLRTRRSARRGRKKDLTTNPTGNYLGAYRPISTRPTPVEERVEVGHWEGDLIAGEGAHSYMITLYERVCRLTHLIALPEGKASRHTTTALARWYETLPEPMRLTLTWDQGSELARWAEIDDLFAQGIYFADRHAPWQRGGNEQNNRQIRFWFPRNQPVTDPTGQRIHQALYVLNNQPRRSLGWATPNQLYHAHLRALTG